jgi:hypothetical protein
MPQLIYRNFISRSLMRSLPEARFVFGDNMERRGRGGQARIMRNEPNAIGVVTKRYPTLDEDAYFYDHCEEFISAVRDDLLKVAKAWEEGRDIYVPAHGLGTGLADLPRRAPKLYMLIWQAFDDMAPCPWPQKKD